MNVLALTLATIIPWLTRNPPAVANSPVLISRVKSTLPAGGLLADDLEQPARPPIQTGTNSAAAPRPS